MKNVNERPFQPCQVEGRHYLCCRSFLKQLRRKREQNFIFSFRKQSDTDLQLLIAGE
jgi:hypothetical protein